MSIYQETVVLPSKGVIYTPDICPNEHIVVRAMTTNEEAMMSGATKDNIDNSINQLIKNCIVSGWDAPMGAMASADRLYTLHRIRVVTYGGEYQFEVDCPKCEFESKYTIDLNLLPVTYLEDGDVEPYYVSLPVCKKRIGWRFLRGDDEHEARVYERKIKSRGKTGDPSLVFQLARRIVSVDGKEDWKFNALIKFVNEMHSRDMLYWRKSVNEQSVGLDMEIEVTCRSCGKNHVIDLPLGEDFFRPELSGERESSVILAGDTTVSYDPDRDDIRLADVNARADAEADGGQSGGSADEGEEPKPESDSVSDRSIEAGLTPHDIFQKQQEAKGQIFEE
jgi:hypothetical protein